MWFPVHVHVITFVILNPYPGLGQPSESTHVVYGGELSEETNRNLNTYNDFGAYLRSICHEYGNQIFRVNAKTGESETWQDVLDKSHQISKFLLSSGCSAGSVVAVYCENSFEYTSILLGVLNIGATYTSIDIRLSVDHIIDNLKLSQPSIVFTSKKLRGNIEKVKQEVSSIKLVVYTDSGTLYPQLDGTDLQYVLKNKNDTAMISYTSGTTNLPKGVMQPHGAWIFQMELYRTEKIVPFPANNVSTALLPPGRTYELITILTSFVCGQKYIMIEEYDNLFHYIEKYKISTFYTNPFSAEYLTGIVPNDVQDISSVQQVLVGADFLQPRVEELLKSRYDCGISYLYGQTETAGFTIISFLHKTHGHLVPGMKGKIIDIETGTALEAMKPGELCLQGPMVFNGYLGGVSTREVLDSDGWFHTGDFGYHDGEANFYILDRLKTLMKCEGGRVSPIEIEMLLLKHPELEDAAVVPVPDKLEGYELPRAYVVKKPGSPVTEEVIMRYVEDNLPKAKCLTGGVKFVDHLPKINDKVAKREVRKWATEDPENFSQANVHSVTEALPKDKTSTNR